MLVDRYQLEFVLDALKSRVLKLEDISEEVLPYMEGHPRTHAKKLGTELRDVLDAKRKR